jgi:hypothetical protein
MSTLVLGTGRLVWNMFADCSSRERRYRLIFLLTLRLRPEPFKARFITQTAMIEEMIRREAEAAHTRLDAVYGGKSDLKV